MFIVIKAYVYIYIKSNKNYPNIITAPKEVAATKKTKKSKKSIDKDTKVN
jgi:hypothetical protein